MRAVFPFLLLALSACTSAPAPSPALSPRYGHVEEAAQLVGKSVALVAKGKSGTLNAYCSGVWVSERDILTANHCVEDLTILEPLQYVTRQDVSADSYEVLVTRKAVLAARDESHDLALLRALAPPSHFVAAVTIEPLAPGMFVQTMGQPLGFWWSYSSGEIAAIRKSSPATEGDDFLFVQATVPISPGNSGGALFDAYGMIAGICHGNYPRGQAVNFFIHPTYIEAFLKAQHL
jgi:S1-C subfamily serine protease